MSESKGKITIGVGSSMQRDLEVTDFIQTVFPDNRIISVADIEDGTIMCSVENPESTGRAPKQSMWLSKESFAGLISLGILYYSRKGIDLKEEIEDMLKAKEFQFRATDGFHKKNNSTNEQED